MVSRDIINNISVHYGHALSDHVPLCCEINLPLNFDEIFFAPVTAMLEQPDKILWEKVTDQELVTYGENLESLASRLCLPVVSCSEHHLCRNGNLSDDIDKLCLKLIDIIHLAFPHLPHEH